MQKSDVNIALNRLVRKLEPPDDQSQYRSLQTFSQYLKTQNIILLGDPGSGKTHIFRAGATEEKALFLTIREFLIMEESERQGDLIYLDGLDEFRSRIDDKNSVSEVIKQLKHFKRPQLRLSCRIADWLGETDLYLFRQYFGDNSFVVLSLEPLNKEEIGVLLRAKVLTTQRSSLSRPKSTDLADFWVIRRL